MAMRRNLFQPTFNYSGIQGANLAPAAAMIIQGFNAPGEIFKGMQEQQRKDAADARANELLNIQKAQEQRAADKVLQDKLLGEALVGAGSNLYKDVKVPVAGTPSNQEEIDRINKINADITARNERVASGKPELLPQYDDLYKQYLNMPADKKGYGFKYTPDEAKARAAQEAQNMNAGKEPIPLMEVPKFVAGTPGTTKIEKQKMDKEEWAQNAYKSIMSNPNLSGESKLTAINKLAAQADALYGKDTTLTPSEMRARTESLQKQQDAMDYAKAIANEYNITIPKGLSPKAAKEFVDEKISKDKANKGEYSTSKSMGTMVDLGIDNDDRKDILDVAKQYKIKDVDLQNLLKAYNNDYTLIPRFSGSVAEDVIKDIKENYKKR